MMIRRIAKIIIPSAMMLLLIYLLRGGKDILEGLFCWFPLMYIAMGVICTDFVKELLAGMVLTSLAFLIPINLCFNMGTCIGWVLIYIALSCASFFIKELIKKKMKSKKTAGEEGEKV